MKVKTQVNVVRESFVTNKHGTMQPGRKAGAAVQAGAITAAATVVAGAGALVGFAQGFWKGLVS